MKIEPLPPVVGNGRRMRTIEFDEADAPLLMAAMRLAAATALTYGAGQRKARARLKHYQEMFRDMAPPEASMFQHEAAWCEIAIAMDSATEFVVRWHEGRWPDHASGRASVTVGDRRWETGYSEPVTRERCRLLAAALDEMAPPGCVLIDEIDRGD